MQLRREIEAECLPRLLALDVPRNRVDHVVLGEPDLHGLEQPADGLGAVDGQESPFTMPPVDGLYFVEE